MKWLLLLLLSVGMPPWVNAVAAEASDEAREVVRKVVIEATGDEGTATHAIFVTGDGDEPQLVCVGVGDKDGRSERRIAYVVGDGADKDRGWLGVSIGKVSEALAVQLDLENEGILIDNVVEGGPADKAGLEQHDILIAIDGEAVTSDVGEAVKLVSSRKAGDAMEVVVLREGREKTFTVTLGSRADMKLRWKHDVPAAEFTDRVTTHGKIIRKGDDDQWVVEDLGDLDELEDLPKHLRMFVPRSGEASAKLFFSGGDKVLELKVERDGNTIQLQREGDGPITVTRTDADGAETTAVYDSPQELEEVDPDAFELLHGVGKGGVVHLNLDGVGGIDGAFDLDLQLDDTKWKATAEEWEAHLKEWREQMEEHLSRARESYERAMEQFRDQAELWQDGDASGKLRFLFFKPEGGVDGKTFGGHKWFGRGGKPAHTFEVLADGTIEVRIRRGDSELLERFAGEDDLADRRPKLYDKFLKLRDADQENE